VILIVVVAMGGTVTMLYKRCVWIAVEQALEAFRTATYSK